MLRAVRAAVCCGLIAGCGPAVPVAGASRALTAAFSQSEPSPRAAPPLYLEVWARVHGSAIGPLERDMPLRTGDRIGLSARTSSAAHVLLMHCDRRAVLSVYPAQGALPFQADRRVQLPAAGMDLQLGSDAGRELLYVLASRAPLREADPQLYAAVMQASDAAPACGPAFETLLSGATVRSKRRAALAAVRGVDVSDALRGVSRAFAEEDGVVVLGFAFEHLAP